VWEVELVNHGAWWTTLAAHESAELTKLQQDGVGRFAKQHGFLD
jgi:hypothetical protein